MSAWRKQSTGKQKKPTRMCRTSSSVKVGVADSCHPRGTRGCEESLGHGAKLPWERVWRAKIKLLAAQMDIATGRRADGGEIQVKGETPCSALGQKSAGCPHCKAIHAETMAFPSCHPHMQRRAHSVRCWLEPEGNFYTKSSLRRGWYQPVPSLGGCKAPARCRAGLQQLWGTITVAGCAFFLQKSLQRSSREALQAAGLLQALSSKKSALQKW